MEWSSGLSIDGVEVTFYDDSRLDMMLEAFYELVYKYQQLDMHKWAGAPDSYESKEEALAICEAGIRDMAAEIAQGLIYVYDHWLEQHAITEPKKWGKARVEMEDEVGTLGGPDALENVISEFAILSEQIGKGPGARYDVGHREGRRWWKNVFLRELPDRVEELPVFKRLAKPYLDELYQIDLEEWKSGSIGGNLDEKPQKRDISDFFDIYDVEEFAQGLDPDDLKDLLAELYTVMVFPVWYGRWKKEGIDKTRDRIEKASKQLHKISKKADHLAIDDLNRELNIIINLTHQTGSMLDYIQQIHGEVTSEFLENLSNMDVSEFDEELVAMGMSELLDPSVIMRKRSREDARQIVRSAWERTAARERGEDAGLENPMIAGPLSRQQAVLRELGVTR